MEISGYLSVAHRYWNASWTSEKNQAVYGQSASPEGVGSNLRLILEGDESVQEALQLVKSRLDHRELAQVTHKFYDRASTLESVAAYIAEEILEPGEFKWSAVTLWELDDRRACRVERFRSAGEMTLIENYRNLTLAIRVCPDAESGLGLSRATVAEVVDQVFSQYSGRWNDEVLMALQGRLPGLLQVAIDLGCQRVLQLADLKPSL